MNKGTTTTYHKSYFNTYRIEKMPKMPTSSCNSFLQIPVAMRDFILHTHQTSDFRDQPITFHPYPLLTYFALTYPDYSYSVNQTRNTPTHQHQIYLLFTTTHPQNIPIKSNSIPNSIQFNSIQFNPIQSNSIVPYSIVSYSIISYPIRPVT